MAASAVKAPKQFANLSIVTLAESGKQQNIAACIGPVDEAILVDFKPETLFETFHLTAVAWPRLISQVLDFLCHLPLVLRRKSCDGF